MPLLRPVDQEFPARQGKRDDGDQRAAEQELATACDLTDDGDDDADDGEEQGT